MITEQELIDALESAQKRGHTQDQINAYIRLGNHYLGEGDTPKGFTQFDQAVKIAKTSKDKAAEATVEGLIGMCLKQIGNYESAMQAFRRSLRLAKKIDSKVLEGDALYQIGALLVDQGEPLEAIGHLDNAFIIAMQNQDNQRKFAATNLMGKIFLSIESVDKANENFATALEIAREIGNKEAEAASRVYLGQTFLMDEGYNAAAENFEYALNIADQIGSVSIEMQALHGLMKACAGGGKTSLAVIYGEQLINKARSAEADLSEVQAIITLSSILGENGQFAKQIPHLLRGLEIVRKNQDSDLELNFLSDLGVAYYQTDDLDHALTSMEQAREIAVRFQNEQEEAVIVGRLASIKADLGDFEASNSLAEHTVELSEKLDLPLLAGQQWVIMAMNYNDLGNKESALEYLHQAIELYRNLDQPEMLARAETLLEEFS